MRSLTLFLLIAIITTLSSSSSVAITTRDQSSSSKPNNTRFVIDVKGGPDAVLWVVQLSDLHFSVHSPQRALDFARIVGPTLSFLNPSLVLLTGDLTDGKSKDMLTMKVDEDEWREYRNVMRDVVERSGLDKSVFFDLRGNHDHFGVPEVGGPLDFFSKYSINGELGRTGKVNSVTLRSGEQKHLFVGVDSTGNVGLRGPTNLFGNPTDELLTELDSELSQWDAESTTKPPIKISFGHFPLSFSASSSSGKSLKDVFLKHSVSAYLCGHLHTKFGENLKRHHRFGGEFATLDDFVQLSPHPLSYEANCSVGAAPIKEFWEWEMGDWRKSRVMRVLAIDRGHVSYVDINFKSGANKSTVILPTFPLDSRFMSTSLARRNYECQVTAPSLYESIRALVFSASPIVLVMARVYDMMPGNPNVVLEAEMSKIGNSTARGDLYVSSWNYRAFEDPSPDRYWLQIEATNAEGESTLTELRPFSVNGLNAKFSWTWAEIKVMGCQWSAIYFPLLWSALCFMFGVLLVPKALIFFSKKRFTYKDFVAHKGLANNFGWGFFELCKLPLVWYGLLGYLFYLILFPWLVGKVFTEGDDWGYMTYRGWVIRSSNLKGSQEYIGFPDVIVVILSHLFYVVFPSVIVTAILAAERGAYREHFLSVTGKKEDDENGRDWKPKSHVGKRWARKVVLLVCLAICWKHFKNCWALVKAYEMNLMLHCPVYGFAIPLLLGVAVYETRGCL